VGGTPLLLRSAGGTPLTPGKLGDMSDQLWADVDRYITDLLVGGDEALDGALADSDAAGLPSIAVAPNQGKLLHILASAIRARDILEIGTLGGYSTIWLARALAPGGRLVTLEADAKHAEVARANLDRAGLAGIVEIRVGQALATLPSLAGPFDLVFIDADKPNNPEYFKWAVRLTRPGGLIIVDNVIRRGDVIDADNGDPTVRGTRRLHEALAAEPKVLATVIQTVGSKGHDGFAVALVR
jgi:predicted O-methyltransferase YrrM